MPLICTFSCLFDRAVHLAVDLEHLSNSLCASDLLAVHQLCGVDQQSELIFGCVKLFQQ